MITHTISITELIWTGFCSIALVYNFRILNRAYADLQSIKERKINSIREYSSRLTVFTYSTWTIVQALFVILGIIAMFIPPAANKSAVSPFQLALTTGFLFVSLLFAVIAFVNEKGRLTLIKRMENNGSHAGGSASVTTG